MVQNDGRRGGGAISSFISISFSVSSVAGIGVGDRDRGGVGSGRVGVGVGVIRTRNTHILSVVLPCHLKQFALLATVSSLPRPRPDETEAFIFAFDIADAEVAIVVRIIVVFVGCEGVQILLMLSLFSSFLVIRRDGILSVLF